MDEHNDSDLENDVDMAGINDDETNAEEQFQYQKVIQSSPGTKNRNSTQNVKQ